MKKSLFLILAVFFIFFPTFHAITHAQMTATECDNGRDDDRDGRVDVADPQCTTKYVACENGTLNCVSSNGTISQNNDSIQIRLNNPLGVNTIEEAIKKIMDAVLMITIPVVIVMFIYSGFMFISARGNPEGLKKAKKTFLFTLLGATLILGAWTIATAIVGTINSITG